MSGPVAELRDVFCVHRTGQGDAAALQGAELTVAPGEVLCVLGPSGAGKSTLLQVIAGLQTPSAGIVRVMGTDIGRQGERARARFRHRYLGLLGQASETMLSPDLPVANAIELPLALRGVSDRQRRRARAMELLEMVELGDRASALPGQLSGGERQRVALCAAVAHSPSLLLADEPTGELDQASAEAMLDLIARLAGATMMTVIVATHDQAVARVCDRTLTISAGRIAEEMTGAEDTVVVSEAGWMRLPPRLRQRAQIGGRAQASLAAEGLLVHQAGGFVPRKPLPRVTLGVSDLAPVEVVLRDVVFGYGPDRAVLDGLSWAFEPGRMTVITGRTGCGKSTLLRLLVGLERAHAGKLTIDGQAVETLDREGVASLRRRLVGYMPQEPVMVAFLSAVENVILALQLRDVTVHDAMPRTSALLSALALSERANQFVSRLSAGETQRAALARAVACGRGLLVLDEPTSRLDEANARLAAEVLAGARDEGQTIICASHDRFLVSRADEVMTLA